MLTIPVKVDANTEEAQAALKDLANGAKDAFKNILDLDGKEINFTVDFTSKGEKVFKQISAEQAALETQLAKTEQQLKRNIVVQKGSITATKEEIKLLKAQRNGLQQTNPAFTEYGAKIAQAERELRKLEGTQDGSINALKAQRANFVKLRDSVKMNTPQFEALNKQIAAIDERLGKTTKKTVTFFGALSKIATAQAAFNSVTAAFRSIGNTVDQFVRRTKDVQSFEMALKNIGMSQEEVNTTFRQAEVTARELGAPLIQVEKGYKRMLPALRAVGTSASDADKFIAGIAARTATLGLNTEQSGRLTEAFAQVLSKGKLQAEELNQQISELDGAFRTQFATALGVSTEKLNEMITAGEVTAEVFVKAFNRMQNGVEQLRERIAAGNITIQQFQNLISTVETKNLEQIGKIIAPTIKNFLAIRLAVADFISEFSQTEIFATIATVFEQSSEALLRLTQAFIALTSVLAKIIDPFAVILNFILKLDAGFGGLIGIATTFGVVLATSVAVDKIGGFLKLGKFVSEVAIQYKFATGQAVIFTAAQNAANTAVKTSAFANALGSVKAFKAALVTTIPALAGVKASVIALGVSLKALLLNPIVLSIAALGAVLAVFKQLFDIAGELRTGFAGVFKDYLSDTDETASETKKFDGTLGDLNKRAKKSFIVFGSIPNVFNLVNKQLISSTYFANKADGAFKQYGDQIKDIVGTAGDFDAGDLSSEKLAETSKVVDALVKSQSAYVDSQKSLIAEARKRQPQNVKEIQLMEDTLSLAEQQLDKSKKTQKALNDEAMARAAVGDATAAQLVNAEKLLGVLAETNAEINANLIQQQTENIEEYGRSAADASKLIVANLNAEIKANKDRQEFISAFLKQVQDDREKEITLSDEVLKAEQKLKVESAQLSKERANNIAKASQEIFNAYEKEIQRTQAITNTYAKSASDLKGAFDGISGALSSGLQSSLGLLEAVIQTETQGLDQNSARRKELALIQLQNAVRVADIEQKLALTKLRIENTIAQNQARVAQLRLQAEAKIAAARGDTGLAGALQEAAQLQGQIRQGLQAQLKIEEGIIGIERQKTNQLLINEGLQKGIGANAAQVAQKLGVQNTSIKQATNKVKQFASGATKIAESFGKAATKASDLSRETEETSIDNALKAAKGLTSQLEAGSEAGNAASQAIGVLSGNLGGATQNASAMSTELKRGLDFANRLANVAGSGLPARALGGPVAAGQSYMVNDGGGREGFLSASGRFSMLPAARNMRWTAPSSGTIIPANLVDGYINANMSNKIQGASAGLASHSIGSGMSSGVESGNLIKQMTNAIGAAGGNQRITNNVTIQSEKPVQDASKIMANVARMRLRNSRRM